MKILFLSPKFSFPARSGSALFASRYIAHLSKNHEVDLMSFDTSETAAQQLPASALSGRLISVPPLPRQKIMINAVQGVLRNEPLPVTHYASWESRVGVQSTLLQKQYDAAIFQLLEMAQFLPKDCKAASILSMEDPLSLKNERWLPFIKSPKLRLRSRIEISRLRQYERLKTPLFDKTVLINRADADDFEKLTPGAKVDWSPYGVDTDFFVADQSVERVPGMIVISGTMSHPPNVDGILYFCNNVFPLIRSKNTQAHLCLVGANPTPEITALANDHIRVVGSVPDIRQYLRQAMVSVCAVRLKIGTQTKVLEAMACGTPVVTTTAGNNGVEAISGEQAFVSDIPSEMADMVSQLLNGENWNHVSEGGRRFTVERFDWSASCAKFESVILETVAQKRQIRIRHE